MNKWNSETEAKEEILKLVEDYYHQFKEPKKPFEPGDRIHYASRVYDEKEMTNLVDSALEFWLTSGRFTEEFEKKLGYTFKDKSLLELAFTHTTYVFEHNMGHHMSNQRLEYIGDAVIDLVVGRKLYDMVPEAAEGYLSKTRSIIVCERSFAAVSRNLGVGKFLKLGKGKAATGGDDKDSTLADAHFSSQIN